MIYQNPNECMGNRSSWEKLLIALKILANPWLLLLDKMGLVKSPVYRSRTGMSFVTRGKTTDINDAVVVLSGNEYPPELVGLDKHTLGGKIPIVLDCGGHIGSFSMYIKSRWPEARILAMEPVPDNIQLFNENISRNNLSSVILVPYALYGASGTFYIDLAGKQFDAVHVTPHKPNHEQYITINALTLDEVLAQQNISNIDLLKLDVEGAEYHIFEHSLDALRTHVRRIIMEFHPAGDKAKRDEIVNRLCGDGSFELIYESKNILGFDNTSLEKKV